MLFLFPFFFVFLSVTACPESYSRDSYGNCYKVYATAKPRLQALKTCQDDGAILFNVPNAEQNANLQQLGAQVGSSIWVGSTCTTTDSYSCFDDEGNPNYFTNFASGPNTANGGACVYLQTFSGQWFSQSCSTYAAQFVCLYTGNINAKSCEKGFWMFNSTCYRAAPPDYPITSEQLCANYNGNTASIHSIGESNFVTDVAQNSFGSTQNFFRIGMVFDNYSNPYWSDGSDVNYSNLKLTLPGDCVDVSLTGQVVRRGEWFRTTCHQQIVPICKKAAIVPGQNPVRNSVLCNSQTTVTNQTLFSPNYPLSYGSEDCTSIIVFPQDNIAYLQFPELYLDTGSYINLYNSVVSPTPIAIVTYNSSTLTIYPFSTGTIKIQFVGRNNQKVPARWRAVTTTMRYQEYFSAGPKCNQVLVDYGQFTTNLYDTNILSPGCEINFQARGGLRASLAFNDFYVGPQDVVTFYDGANTTAKVIGRYSGAQPGLTIEASQQYLKMVVSQVSSGYRGIWGSFYSN